MKKLIILGCTGSIGQTALKALENDKSPIEIVGLSAYTKLNKLLEIAKKFSVKTIATPLADVEFIQRAKSLNIKVFTSIEDMIVATESDLVLNGIAGTAGLKSSIATLSSEKDLALANKESIVMAGKLLKELAKNKNKKIFPVDSEHSCLAELIQAHGKDNVDKLFITASGGPFRNYSLSQLEKITPLQASNHPTWKMGKKISIDSSTLANKALEIIEASILFDFPPTKIEPIINPTSQVHSLIGLKNGQTYAQISQPNMTFPIMNAIYKAFNYSYELSPPTSIFSFLGKGLKLEFYPLDQKRFPMIRLGFECLNSSKASPIVFNAANEVAVNKFCLGEINFLQIPILVEDVLIKMGSQNQTQTFEEIFEIDRKTREIGEKLSKTL